MSPLPLPPAPTPPEIVVLDQAPAPNCSCGAPRLLMFSPAEAPPELREAEVLLCLVCDDWPHKGACIRALLAAMTERGL